MTTLWESPPHTSPAIAPLYGRNFLRPHGLPRHYLTSYLRAAPMACTAIFCAERRKFVVNRGRGARHEAPLPGYAPSHQRVPSGTHS
jgi:hypothetical protein